MGEVVDSDELVSMINMTLNDPSSFDCALFEGSGLDGVTVNSLPRSVIEPYVVDVSYLSACC